MEGDTESKPKMPRKYRFKSATIAAREIKKYQKSTQRLIPKRAIDQLARELAQQYRAKLRFQGKALDALHEAAEEHLTTTLRQAGSQAAYAGRRTIQASDLYDMRREPELPVLREDGA